MEEDKLIHPSILKSITADNERIFSQIEKLRDEISSNSKSILILNEKVNRTEKYEAEDKALQNTINRERAIDSALVKEFKEWKDAITNEIPVKEFLNVPKRIDDLDKKINGIVTAIKVGHTILLIIIAVLGLGFVEIKCNKFESGSGYSINSN
jgi:predicted RNase H-like nuclease (RuvC/YqgF family)